MLALSPTLPRWSVAPTTRSILVSGVSVNPRKLYIYRTHLSFSPLSAYYQRRPENRIILLHPAIWLQIRSHHCAVRLTPPLTPRLNLTNVLHQSQLDQAVDVISVSPAASILHIVAFLFAFASLAISDVIISRMRRRFPRGGFEFSGKTRSIINLILLASAIICTISASVLDENLIQTIRNELRGMTTGETVHLRSGGTAVSPNLLSS